MPQSTGGELLVDSAVSLTCLFLTTNIVHPLTCLFLTTDIVTYNPKGA